MESMDPEILKTEQPEAEAPAKTREELVIELTHEIALLDHSASVKRDRAGKDLASLKAAQERYRLAHEAQARTERDLAKAVASLERLILRDLGSAIGMQY